MIIIDPKEVINGCEVFDKEHLMLVNLLNAVYKLLKEGRKKEAKELFKEGVVKYTDKHLRHEGEVMQKFGFPELEIHRKTHEVFRKVIVEDIKHLDNPKIFASEAALAMSWVRTHIKKTDKKYVEFFKKQGCWEEACKLLEKPVEIGVESILREILKDKFLE